MKDLTERELKREKQDALEEIDKILGNKLTYNDYRLVENEEARAKSEKAMDQMWKVVEGVKERIYESKD